jgi:hypothetical protein
VYVVEIGDDGKETGYWLQHREIHSPDGFQWGYGGSGPADLAYSILYDYFNADQPGNEGLVRSHHAMTYYQKFKWEHVAGFEDDWEISALDIADWLAIEIADA